MTRRATTRKPVRKPVNVSVDAELLARARAEGINISRVVDHALAGAVQRSAQQRWLEANRRALEDYNAFVERHGTFADELRGF